MKKRGREKRIKIRLSDRLSYTLILIGILAIVGVGVYALAPGVIPNPGHNISQVSVPSPCSSGQILSYNGNTWVCINKGCTPSCSPSGDCVDTSTVTSGTGTKTFFCSSGYVMVGIEGYCSSASCAVTKLKCCTLSCTCS